MLKAPCFGVGSQLNTLSGPGDADCKYPVVELSASCLMPGVRSRSSDPIYRIVHEVVGGVIHRQ